MLRSCRKTMLTLTGSLLLAALFVFSGALAPMPFIGEHFSPDAAYARIEPEYEIIGDGDLGTLYTGFTQSDAEEVTEIISIKNNGSKAISVGIRDISEKDSGIGMTRLIKGVTTIEVGQTAEIVSAKPETGLASGEYNASANITIWFDDGGNETEERIHFHCNVINNDFSLFCGFWPNRPVSSGFDAGSSVEGAGLTEWMAEGRSFELMNDGNVGFNFRLSSESELFDLSCEDPADADRLMKESDMIRLRVRVNEQAVRAKAAGEYSGNVVIDATSSDGRRKTVKIPVKLSVLPAPRLEKETDRMEVSSSNMYNVRRSLGAENDWLLPDIGKYIKYESSNRDVGVYTDHGSPELGVGDSVTGAGTYTSVINMYYDPTGSGNFPEEPCDSMEMTIEVWDPGAYEFAVYDGERLLDTESPELVDLGILYEGYKLSDANRLERQIRLKNTGSGPLEFCRGSMKADGDEDSFVFSKGDDYTVVQPGGVYSELSVRPAVGLPAGRYNVRVYFGERSGRSRSRAAEFSFTVVRKGLDFDTKYYRKDIPENGVNLGTFFTGSSYIGDWLSITNTGEYDIDYTVKSEGGLFDITESKGRLRTCGEAFIGFRMTREGLNEGSYTDKLIVTASRAGGSDKKEVTVPVRFRLDNSKADFTLDLQGVGELENLVRKDVPASGRVMDEANRLGRLVEYQLPDGYVPLGITLYPDSHYKSWSEYISEANDQDKYERLNISDAQRVYLNWAKQIKAHTITVKAPPCGSSGDALPEVIIPGASHYHAAEIKYFDSAGNSVEKLGFGEGYRVRLVLGSDWGHAFKEREIRANGELTYSWTGDLGGKLVINMKELRVTDHDWDEGAVTTPAKADSEGVKTLRCRGCGATSTVSIPKLSPGGQQGGSGGQQAGDGSQTGKAAEIKDLAAVKSFKAKAGKRSATLSWKKIANKELKKTKKIEIQYSTDRKFKKSVKKKYVSSKLASVKIKGLKSKKTYHVRVRAYTKTGGKVHVSKWSAVKKVKAK